MANVGQNRGQSLPVAHSAINNQQGSTSLQRHSHCPTRGFVKMAGEFSAALVGVRDCRPAFPKGITRYSGCFATITQTVDWRISGQHDISCELSWSFTTCGTEPELISTTQRTTDERWEISSHWLVKTKLLLVYRKHYVKMLRKTMSTTLLIL